MSAGLRRRETVTGGIRVGPVPRYHEVAQSVLVSVTSSTRQHGRKAADERNNRRPLVRNNG